MEPVIKSFPGKKLAGHHLRMSLAENSTFALWSGFMPRRKEIEQAVGNEMYSVQVYDPAYNFQNFDLHAFFEKWAAVEVPDFDAIPAGMEALTIPPGLYAVFTHKGPASEGERTFRYIFETWLPASGYVLDQRPHFELLGEKYRNNSPDSEEEIYIPVRLSGTT